MYFFWDENNPAIASAIAEVLGDIKDETMSVVVARVDQDHPFNRVPVSKRLKALEKEILEKSVVMKT